MLSLIFAHTSRRIDMFDVFFPALLRGLLFPSAPEAQHTIWDVVRFQVTRVIYENV